MPGFLLGIPSLPANSSHALIIHSPSSSSPVQAFVEEFSISYKIVAS